MSKILTVSDVVSVVKMSCRISGDEKTTFVKAVSLTDGVNGSIVWVSTENQSKNDLVAKSSASIVICDGESASGQTPQIGRALLIVENPRLAFLRVVAAYFQSDPSPGIHPAAFIHPDATIGDAVYIGPFAYVGKCFIGNNVVIHGHVHLYDNVSIGDRVTIHAGTVIGADGFGYERNQDGVLEKFPHIFGVTVEDDVEIGANTTIDRGTLRNTLIRQRARIDNLVHIAHNVVVGEDVGVVANALIGGSTEIGSKAWVAPSATLRDGISIGSGVTIGMSALVTKSVPAGETWTGIPAKKIERKSKK